MAPKNPAAFRFARFLVRASVVLTIGLIAWDVVRRVGQEPPGRKPFSPDQEVVALKGRIAQLELEIERLRKENARLHQSTEDEN